MTVMISLDDTSKSETVMLDDNAAGFENSRRISFWAARTVAENIPRYARVALNESGDR